MQSIEIDYVTTSRFERVCVFSVRTPGYVTIYIADLTKEQWKMKANELKAWLAANLNNSSMIHRIKTIEMT